MTDENKHSKDLIHCGCGECHELITRLDKWGHERRFKNGHQNRGSLHGMWKGHTFIDVHGYRHIFMPEHPRAQYNGYVLEHIVILETKLGRSLLPSEFCHHINRNKLDNRPENLTNMTNSQHMSHHMKGNKHGYVDMSNRVCSDCGSTESYRRSWQSDGDKLRCNKCYMKQWHKLHPKRNRARAAIS